jgi:hypothetical protein
MYEPKIFLPNTVKGLFGYGIQLCFPNLSQTPPALWAQLKKNEVDSYFMKQLKGCFTNSSFQPPCEVGDEITHICHRLHRKMIHSFHPPLPPMLEEVSFLSLSLFPWRPPQPMPPPVITNHRRSPAIHPLSQSALLQPVLLDMASRRRLGSASPTAREACRACHGRRSRQWAGTRGRGRGLEQQGRLGQQQQWRRSQPRQGSGTGRCLPSAK